MKNLKCKIFWHNYLPKSWMIHNKTIYINYFICSRKGCGDIINVKDIENKDN